VLDLHDVGGEKRHVDREEETDEAAGAQARPAPAAVRDDVEEHGGDGHRARHGDAVRGAQGSRRAEAEDEQEAARHQAGIDVRHVDLPDLRARGVDDRQPRAGSGSFPARGSTLMT